MKTVLFTLLLILGCIGSFARCDTPSRPLSFYVDFADLIVHGTVLSDTFRVLDPHISHYEGAVSEVKILVKNTYKGTCKDTIVVYNNGLCYFDFFVGKDYLIFAHYSVNKLISKNAVLATANHIGNEPFSDTSEKKLKSYIASLH